MSVPPLVAPGPALTAAEVERYSRHLLLPQVGAVGQRRLRQARVCVVGAGGLGAPVLLYLAAAGVGRIGIVDFDAVEVTNLQRQVVHGRADVGRAKVDSARDAVLAIDPELDVVAHSVRLTADTVDAVLAGYDLVIDGTDNFPTRYLVNDACVRLGIPEVWGSVFRFDAQVSVFWGRPPAGSGVDPVQLRDLFPAPPPPGSVPSCAEGGVLGALCGQVGSVMATEAVKLIVGAGDPLLGRVLVLDALASRWSEVALRGDPARSPARDLPGAGAEASPATGADPGAACQVGAAAAGSADDADAGSLSARQLAAMLAGASGAVAPGSVAPHPFVLIDVREPAEREIVSISGAVAVPLGAILDGEALPELPRDRQLVLHCRSGARSAQAVLALRAAGFDDVVHLRGGVLAWIDDVDSSLPRY